MIGDTDWLVPVLFGGGLLMAMLWSFAYLFVWPFLRRPRREPAGGGGAAPPGPAPAPGAKPPPRPRDLAGENAWLVLLVGAVMLYFLITSEAPLLVRVHPDAVETVYRMPWRNEYIPAAEIERVQLVWYSRSRRGLGTTWPALIISRQKGDLRLMAHSGSFEPAIVDAYEAVARVVGPEKAAPPTPRPSP